MWQRYVNRLILNKNLMIKLHKNTPFLEMALLGAKNWAFLSHAEGIFKKIHVQKITWLLSKSDNFFRLTAILALPTQRGGFGSTCHPCKLILATH
jgi:hypothetical protein